jgi:hypothetical protein
MPEMLQVILHNVAAFEGRPSEGDGGLEQRDPEPEVRPLRPAL